MGNEVRYDINFTDLEEKAKSCKFMLFCNPHNPSGRVWNQAEVERVVGICQRNGILIIGDEILSDLILPSHRWSFYSMVNCNYPRIVICPSLPIQAIASAKPSTQAPSEEDLRSFGIIK